MTGIKLNLGCGGKTVPGYVGVDLFPCDGARVRCDITRPMPFREGSVEGLLLDNVIEHVPDIAWLMGEMRRICKPGARIRILTPHFSSLSSWRDPTHLHHLSWFSIEHFTGTRHYTPQGFRLVRRKLSFVGGPLGLVARILFAISPDAYEKHFCFVFRAGTLDFEVETTE